MTAVNVGDVRKHFVVNQRSKDSPNDFDKIKGEVSKLSDEEIKKEIYKRWAGKEDQANNFFLNDELGWWKTEIDISQIKNPYSDFRKIVTFQPYTKNPSQILELLKNADSPTIKNFEDANVEEIKKKLPIFAVNNNGILLVHDGWFRTLTLAFKNIEKIEAYLTELNHKNVQPSPDQM